jgi:hypothetical protein
MAAYKMAAVKFTPPNDFPPRSNKVTYGCYPSIPHALRFTKGGKGLMPHPVDIFFQRFLYWFISNIFRLFSLKISPRSCHDLYLDFL